MALTIEELLDRNRKELLDLSTRNRLLSIPVSSKLARIIQVRDELSEHIFRLLVAEKKSFSFLPGRAKEPAPSGVPPAVDPATDDDSEEIGLPQPEEEAADGVARRHLDVRLQTALSPETLQTRLLNLYRDALTMMEEQGVNILYLALGQLKWFDPEQPEVARFAPLILVPVKLERKTASERFRLSWNEEEIEENLSLEAKLKADFNLALPAFPEEEDWSANAYFASVTQAIAGAQGWEVLPNAIVLGFFSFAKFLMYRDLDPVNWPQKERLVGDPLVTGLLRDGFAEQALPEKGDLDELIPVARLDHVVDADSSQTEAIELVRQGRSVVIQGPPGTGKSQSITNLIATAVLEGKRVLFVAEKLAALEVVKRRLEREGLGALCLELHSNKSNKRAVIDEIGRTWKLGRPVARGVESNLARLADCRTVLNQHARILHQLQTPAGVTLFDVIGRLALLGDRAMEGASLTFSRAEEWTPQEANERRGLAEELAARVQEMGLPAKHPWRGVGRETVLVIDLPPLEAQIRSFLHRLNDLRAAASALANLLSLPAPATLREAEQQRLMADFIAQAPPVDKRALDDAIWDGGLEGLRDLIASGFEFARSQTAVGEAVTAAVWDQDFTKSRAALAAHGRSWFRFLQGDYRRAVAQVRGAMTGELPKDYVERIALVDHIIRGQRALRVLEAGHHSGELAFGSFWRREKSDWRQLEAVLDWVARQRDAGLDASFRRRFAELAEPDRVAPLRDELSLRLTAARETGTELARNLALDFTAAYGVPLLDQIPLAELDARGQSWLAQLGELPRWNNYFVRARRARESGMGTLVDGLEQGGLAAAVAGDAFDRIYLSQLLREFTRRHPALGGFDGMLHDHCVTEFRQLDKDRLALAKYQVLVAHHAGMPLQSGVGGAGIMKAEMERKRGHRTVRRLVNEAGSVVQAIKPVFMMSPLSVAQFLAPGAVEFDLLVIDEASQVQPVDALGAVARCKQIVVVGDSKQLPPTRFFLRLTADVPEEDLEEDPGQAAQAKDIESILGLCCARGLPQTMLRWHYRSRHHSLIAVSNLEFYENHLFIIPSPYSTAAGLGLKFNHLPEGVFDAGASGTNRIEARAIVAAIIEHARKTPELTLGVATFSLRQQQAILDELESRRRENPDLESFYTRHPAEPFFIKNLESVQGDERDVIFISVGYGRDPQGHMAMRFGPLSHEGGERRLNVLISRAKRRCEVFSSITAEEIDLNRASGRGVAALKTFLAFAATGRLAAAPDADRAAVSSFDQAVRRALEGLGYEVHPQVGLAGFFIDLAVADRAQSDRYLLGVESDGAAYVSSRSARDRDRLRQAVLEDHGWIIHRLWSMDWLQRPAEQLRKLAEAVDRAKRVIGETETAAEPQNTENRETGKSDPGTLVGKREGKVGEGNHGTPGIRGNREEETGEGNHGIDGIYGSREGGTGGAPAAAAGSLVEREAADESVDHALGRLSGPYTIAQVKVPVKLDPHEVKPADLAAILFRVVEIEAPIHEEEVVNRLRDLWGRSRAGPRMHEAVAAALALLLAKGKCAREDGFILIPGAAIPVRTRENVSSSNLRKPEMLPGPEIRATIRALIDAHHGAARDEIPAAVARILGFKTTSPQLRAVIDAQTAKLLSDGALQESHGLLKTPPPK